MTARLTDAWLTSMARVAERDAANYEITEVVPEAMTALIAEIRSHRAAVDAKFSADAVAVLNDDGKMRRVYLTGREVEALEWAGSCVERRTRSAFYLVNDEERTKTDAALAVLDKLTRSKP